MTEFLRRMQLYVANLAITTSVFRAKGSAGAMQAAIDFVSAMDLAAIPRSVSFSAFLDEQTEALQSALPSGWQPWGPARKAINVFLRDASYNAFLRDEYGLDQIEADLETPVDSRIATALRRQASAHKLPRFDSIVRLTPQDNRAYQIAALDVADRLGTHRGHLDLWFWRPTDINQG